MRLLIIGDLGGELAAATRIASNRGVTVRLASDINHALTEVRNGKGADLILIDCRQDILNLVTSLKMEHITLPVIACGVRNSKEEAVRAIKSGAKEFLPLPPNEELIAAVFEAIAEDSRSVIGNSTAMMQVTKMAEQVAPSEANILITGESGTGKEVFSRFIHQKSKRAAHDLVSVNCAAIPENLLESELFGHEKGAFTGAIERRIGKFEEANNSTLLLDEISEMDIRLQAKLLRAIQEKEIDRVGGSKPVKVNIRIIATSNRNLQEEVKKGNFREDLYFRLNIINLKLPPLRERKEDIDALIPYFIEKYSKLNGIEQRPINDAAIAKLKTYHWPGNIREFENTIHRAILLTTGSIIDENAIILTHESESISSDGVNMVGKTLESVEKELILNTIDHCLGNRTHAANILGISIRTLRNKLNEYNLE